MVLIYSFIQNMFIEHLFYIRHCSRTADTVVNKTGKGWLSWDLLSDGLNNINKNVVEPYDKLAQECPSRESSSKVCVSSGRWMGNTAAEPSRPESGVWVFFWVCWEDTGGYWVRERHHLVCISKRSLYLLGAGRLRKYQCITRQMRKGKTWDPFWKCSWWILLMDCTGERRSQFELVWRNSRQWSGR